ncbi:MAG: hypothetical protein ACREV6_22075 [Clostridium sp.]|uniref:hypothetical protein n=1 Tax=Clostridium sp. TaxID=1506 RepID=UPI003D6D0D2F
MKVTLLTQWKDKELVCCCPLVNKCNKNHGCEELDFTLDAYANINECMGQRVYKRVNGAMTQRR